MNAPGLTGEDIGAPQGLDSKGAAKLTIYAGRGQRRNGLPAHEQALELLRRRGVTAAFVIPAVDGTRHGERQRARFFSRNVEVPLMLLAAGPVEAVAASLPELGHRFHEPVVTLERVRLCKRDGVLLGDPLTSPSWTTRVCPCGRRS